MLSGDAEIDDEDRFNDIIAEASNETAGEHFLGLGDIAVAVGDLRHDEITPDMAGVILEHGHGQLVGLAVASPGERGQCPLQPVLCGRITRHAPRYRSNR